MMMSAKDLLKSHVSSWRRKVYSDWEDVTSSGRAVYAPAKLTSIFFPVAIETSGVMNQLVLDLLSEIGDASAL